MQTSTHSLKQMTAHMPFNVYGKYVNKTEDKILDSKSGNKIFKIRHQDVQVT